MYVKEAQVHKIGKATLAHGHSLRVKRRGWNSGSVEGNDSDAFDQSAREVWLAPGFPKRGWGLARLEVQFSFLPQVGGNPGDHLCNARFRQLGRIHGRSTFFMEEGGSYFSFSFSLPADLLDSRNSRSWGAASRGGVTW